MYVCIFFNTNHIRICSQVTSVLGVRVHHYEMNDGLPAMRSSPIGCVRPGLGPILLVLKSGDPCLTLDDRECEAMTHRAPSCETEPTSEHGGDL